MRYSFLILLILITSFDAPKLIKTKVADGITASIPADFKLMENADIAQRYPSVRAPLAAYTNFDRDVDFSVNVSATQWPDKNLEIARKFFKVGLSNLFDKVEIISEGIQEIHGKKFIYFEVESRMNGEKMSEGNKGPILKYSYLQYLVEKDRTLVFSFTCAARQKQDWQETAHAVMKSIKVK